MPPRWILDTNLTVALALADPAVLPLRAAAGDGRLRLVVTPRLLQEARGVLARPPLARVLGWDAATIEAELEAWYAEAEALPDAPPASAAFPPCPDPGDRFLFDLLAAHADLSLATRDKRLLKVKRLRARIRRPQDLLAWLSAPSVPIGRDGSGQA
jgi:predicted nucleic acid-binding protein